MPQSGAAPIIEHAPLPIVEVQGSAHLVSYVNSAFCTLLGKTREALVGQPFAAIVEGGESCVPILDRVYATGQAATHDRPSASDPNPSLWLYAMWPALDAGRRPVSVIIQLVKVASSRQSAVAINEALLIAGLRQHELTQVAEAANVRLQLEIAERQKVEVALKEVDRLRNEFLAMLAHELRNPLAPIRAAAEIIGMSDPADPAIRSAQEMITRQVNRMVKLVDDLLDVSLIDRGKAILNMERIDLAGVVTQAVDACGDIIKARGHRVVMHVQLEPPLLIDADPVRIEQIVGNLMINAAKYTAPGGVIHVEVQADDRFAVVRVRDTGAGIEPHMLKQIFDVFTQVRASSSARAEGGLGLGLKLVRDLVSLHGGTVSASSEGLGRGSMFEVCLPALPRGTSRAVAQAAGTLTGGRHRTILVVDDSDDNRESMALMLGMAGHSVTVAHDGEEGVAAALSTLPEVALIDIGLPKLDGYEVARRIRQGIGGKGIFLIALTGYGQEEDKGKAIEAGFDVHLTKPADIAALANALSTLERRSESL